MKVLHVIDALGVGGGAEHSLATNLPLLRQRGISSTVITIFPRDKGLGDQLRRQGFDVTVLESTSWPGRALEMRRRIRTINPDLIHATLFNSCVLSRVANVGSDTPLLNSLVNTSYDPVRLRRTQVGPWKLGAMKAVDGFTARHLVTHFHALTQAVSTEATQVLGIPPARVTVIPRGRASAELGTRTSERRLATRAELGIADDIPVVLNVGRQDEQKGQRGLVEAFASVLEGTPDAVLLIAGREGDATQDIQHAIRRTGTADSVHLLGHRTDVDDLYVAADVFAFPSEYEGLGCALLESMALETPIVGSDAAAVAEVLEDGSLGIVVRRGDREALATALTDLLADEGRRREFATQALERFRETYELDTVVDQMVDLYHQITDQTDSPTA